MKIFLSSSEKANAFEVMKQFSPDWDEKFKSTIRYRVIIRLFSLQRESNLYVECLEIEFIL